MDSKGPNFTAAETNALIEGVRRHHASIGGRFNSTKGGEVTNKKKKEIWAQITRNVNAVGFGQKRTKEQVKFRWKNLKARAMKEARNIQTANKPVRKGNYSDVVLDIIRDKNFQAPQRIECVVGDGAPMILEESVPVLPNAEENLDLDPVIEEEDGSSLAEPLVIASEVQKRDWKRSLPKKDDDVYKSLFQRETKKADVQIRLAEEQITLAQLQQTKAILEIRLLKARLQKAGLPTNEEL